MFGRLAALFAYTGKEGLLFSSALSQYFHFKICGAAFFSVPISLAAFASYANKPVALILNCLRGSPAGVVVGILHMLHKLFSK